MRKKIVILCLSILSLTVYAQRLPLGFPYMEETLRRSQVMGLIDSTVSFLVRPVIPEHLLEDPEVIPGHPLVSPEPLLHWPGGGRLSLMPIQFNAEFHSHHPYGWNNGSMINARGLQTLITGGIYAKWGPLSIQFRPEFLHADNPDYDGFSDNHFDVIWQRRYVLWNKTDLPERFGEGHYTHFLPGQSSVRLNFDPVSFGISTENLWWGPGRRNSLILSNNARGFAHLTLNTTRPVKTPIGAFEGQLIAGRLEASGFDPPQTDRTSQGNRLFIPKPDDWRYLNGLILTYQPKWVPGLYIGAIRVVQQYHERAQANNDYLPVFSNLLRKNDRPNRLDEIERDQAVSGFIRWIWWDAKAELYMEYGRNDASFHFRDFLQSPEHSRAYTVGFSKLFPLSKKDRFLQVSFETTQMQQADNFLVRGGGTGAGSWYEHSHVKHGLTNRGEVLGSGIGPGSNVHFLEFSLINGTNRLGFQLERLVHDNDFYVLAFQNSLDFRRFWVDYSLGINTDRQYKGFLISAKIQLIRSLNYQWELTDFAGLPYFHDGRDVNNLYLSFNIAYPL